MNRNQFNEYIQTADFIRFFNELGWDKAGDVYDITEGDYELKAVAQKRGFMVYACIVETIPQTVFCKKLDIRLRKSSNDYILIFIENGKSHHLWMAPVKTVEKRDLVTIEYASVAQADFLFGKLPALSFGLDETVTIVDVTSRIHSAFEVNSAKITKDFYTGFKKQHTAFSSFISGITVEGDKQWYVSVMLNRLMFCYFIQKKGFLNFDPDYLRHKLEWTKAQQGEDRFFGSFYKRFLRVLFHGGLNSPRHDDNFEQIFGRIPYLNGGLFDEHQLERQYAEVDIADKAFEDLFDFFDKWRWHLDTRITASGKDINPDVLGYIFEQYINDRAQMGAYYTKEDITEYIGKNCIIPFLMDKTLKNQGNNNLIEITVQTSKQKHIYDAVKKGYTTDWKERIPSEISLGIDTTQPDLLERRADWNRPALPEFALPTEIWRETVERLQRCEMLTQKISNGEIMQINDFITYNLDIRSFVFDLLAETKDHKLILHFYHALQNVSILDPTCGSGAFLFAALNILEPLYEICIDRMEEFHKQNPFLFKDELCEIEQKYRSNIQYFIYKSIILRNLYGVDIMCEATEIAKLRLFLKMVVVVEVDRRADNLGLDPLPDIDFNIRCGNTLIGYATEADLDKTFVGTLDFDNDKQKIEDKCDIIAKAFEQYKEIQLTQGDNATEFKQAKDELNKRLKEINDELNTLLHKQYTAISYDKWLASHQPFHWLAEFYEIIHDKGGFDVIIGNPPYVEYGTKLKSQYVLKDYNTIECGNLHAYIAERGLNLLSKYGCFGLIIPLPSINTSRMESLQKLIKPNSENGRNVWISAFDERPSSLFDGVDQRLIIEIMSKISINPLLNTTGIKRWHSDTRELLFSSIFYSIQSKENLRYTKSILKIKNDEIESAILKKFYQNKSILLFKTEQRAEKYFYYRTAGGRYWKVISNKSSGTKTVSEKISYIQSINTFQIISLISSSLFWHYYSCHFDMFNLKDYMIFGFRFSDANPDLMQRLSEIGEDYSNSLELNSEIKLINSKTKGIVEQKQYIVSKSKPIIDEIDKVLASHYGFTEEELDFIINYDIKYRMGSELNEEE